MDKYPQGCRRGGEDEHPIRMDHRVPMNSNRMTTTTSKCRCGKICKNSHGIKIRQARMKCSVRVDASQRTNTASDETQEELGQEALHSAQNLHEVQQALPIFPLEKVQIKWAQACKKTVWEQFDENAYKVLEASAKGSKKKAIGNDHHDHQLSTQTPYIKNHRAVKIHNIRQELKPLKKQHKDASEEQHSTLLELRVILRKRLMTLRRAQWHQRRRKKEPKNELHS